MNPSAILLILLSLVIASGLSFYQYLYKAKNKSKVLLFLAFLRFLMVFGILVLLINPVITRKSLEIEKTPLPIVMDNSSSIVDLKANEVELDLYQKLSANSALQEKFDIQSYQFDSEFRLLDKIDFKGKQSNLDQVAKNLKSIYKNKNYPTILITDGNQTSGNEYGYSFEATNKVYPLVLGDTTTFLDLKINQLHVNKYAFHKNKFPVEVFLNYSGAKNITADCCISQGNTVLSKQSVTFSSSKKSGILNVLLPANKVGLQIFKATISSKQQEKNTYNNTKRFAVEVMDQKSEVAIVAAINHPDIGALKRSIESNAQRKVTVVKPSTIKSLLDYSVLILYQPTTDFKTVFENNKKAQRNTWIVTGNNTDFSFLNQQQDNLVFKLSNQKEYYLSDFNSQFNLFAIDNIGFDHFPPLDNPFGTISSKENVTVLLSSKIRNIPTGAPLLAYAENQGTRSAFLLGESIWKWRLQSHIEEQSFEKFDIFIDKTIQFLASNTSKKALVVNHESYYHSGEAIEISASYFNKNYELDQKARLMIALTNTATKAVKNYDLLKGNNNFSVNLDGLMAGKYNFNVKELNSKNSYTGYFEVLDFDIENQFVNPDLDKLNQLSTYTQGKTYLPNQVEDLVKTLLKDENYKATQKEITKKTPLIDWTQLLIVIALLLAIEWFTRKYNGML